MSRRTLSAALFVCLTVSAEAPPPNITVHTWVREDIFAGFMVNDMVRFEKGLKKLDQWLVDNPNHPSATAWKASTELYLAARANESGKRNDYRDHYTKAVKLFDDAARLSSDTGVLAVTGATMILFADRLAEPDRKVSFQRGLDMMRELEKRQEKALDKMPVHIKGELLAGIAQASARLGDADASKAYLTRIVQTMPGTTYEARAKRWLDQPDTVAKSGIVCLSCHDNGRLEAVLKRQQQQ